MSQHAGRSLSVKDETKVAKVALFENVATETYSMDNVVGSLREECQGHETVDHLLRNKMSSMYN